MEGQARIQGEEAARARAWLEEQRYALALRRGEIVECLLARELGIAPGAAAERAGTQGAAAGTGGAWNGPS